MDNFKNTLNSYLINEVRIEDTPIPSFEDVEEENRSFVEYITENGEREPDELVEINGVEYQVYISKFSNSSDYHFVSPDMEGIGYDLMVGIEFINGNPSIDMVSKNPNTKIPSIVSDIYLYYFVDEYGVLYSGDTQTRMAIRLWGKLFDVVFKTNRYDFGIVDLEKSEDITHIPDKETLSEYYGYDPDMQRYRFVIFKP